MIGRIEYEYGEGRRDTPVKVRLDGQIVGTIQPVLNGWRYYPKGSREGGQTYPTMTEVQRSLEDDNTGNATDRQEGEGR